MTSDDGETLEAGRDGMPAAGRGTIVAFHAHPDDEALLTAGTMARLAAEGNRVVTVFATDGGLGLASSEFRDGDISLAQRRRDEAQASADALGVSRVVWLGYGDSGLDGDAGLPNESHLNDADIPGGRAGGADATGQRPFTTVPVAEAAAALAEVLREEKANVLISYDAAGGYGHPDHVQVHHVGKAAAKLADTPLVLEATIPRDTINRAINLVGKIYHFPPEFDPTSWERAFSPRSAITHRIYVGRYIAAKRAAMAAHASQASVDGDADRTLAALLRIPRPLYDMIFSREWFIDPARPAGSRIAREIETTP